MTDEEEKKALINDIETRLKEISLEKLRRVDWYIDRINRQRQKNTGA